MEIIDKSKRRSLLRKINELYCTTVIWGVWAYLLMPLLSLLLWLLGVRIFYIEVIVGAGYVEFLDLVGKLGWSIVIVFLILRFWGYYNYWRFGKKNRRSSLPLDSIDQKMSEFFRIPLEEMHALRSRKEVILHIQNNGSHQAF